MSRVLTNEQNYYDIADTIRQMKNVNTTYKPRQMASALKDIYSNEVEGTLPLSFQANGNNLLDYRIDGASGGVGERTSNLFDYKTWKNGITGVSNNGNIIFNNDDSFTITANNTNDVFTLGYSNYKLSAKPGTNYYFNFSSNNTNAGLVYIFENGINDNEHKHIAFNQSGKYASFTTQQDTTYIIFRFGVYAANTEITYRNISLIEGNSAPSNYEPYGYKVPVVCGGTTTNIYLDEPILENESISLSDTNVDIPTIDGTNVITIDTTVQPSNVYIQAPKDSLEATQIASELEEI